MQMRCSVCERRSMVGLGVSYPWIKDFVSRSGKSAYRQVCWLALLAFPKHSSSYAVITPWQDGETLDFRYGSRTSPSTG